MGTGICMHISQKAFSAVLAPSKARRKEVLGRGTSAKSPTEYGGRYVLTLSSPPAISICEFLQKNSNGHPIYSTQQDTAAMYIRILRTNPDELHKPPKRNASRKVGRSASRQCVYVCVEGGKAMEGHPRPRRPWVASRQAGSSPVHTKATARTL
ncbi:hypothetical protein LY78DRAFT_660519 [Colletotrichum sublineola]|nr:hypothetical protein LY78DRAFT_660519 [Colletotrichum sublineola]